MTQEEYDFLNAGRERVPLHNYCESRYYRVRYPPFPLALGLAEFLHAGLSSSPLLVPAHADIIKPKSDLDTARAQAIGSGLSGQVNTLTCSHKTPGDGQSKWKSKEQSVRSPVSRRFRLR